MRQVEVSRMLVLDTPRARSFFEALLSAAGFRHGGAALGWHRGVGYERRSNP